MVGRKSSNQRPLRGNPHFSGTFANCRSRKLDSCSAVIRKKQREFYKNAKYISKYKRNLRQQSELQNAPPRLAVLLQEGHDSLNECKPSEKKKKKLKRNSLSSYRDEYEKMRSEIEKARLEREAIAQAKKEEREKAEAHRRELRKKMFKRARSGQPIMKYRVEHLLQRIE